MKKTILILTIIVTLCSCSNDVGRYQIVSSDDHVFLLDTQTGTVWRKTGPKWKNYGTPPQRAPYAGDSFKTTFE